MRKRLTKRQKRLILGIVVPIELVLAALSWRDMSRRTDDQVRGDKRLWRVLVSLNPGNSLLYWLFARR